MARGFGSTLGAGTTDKIVTGSVAIPTQVTFVIYALRHGAGGSSQGRIIAHANGPIFYNDSGNNVYNISFPFSTTAGSWTIPLPSVDVWHTFTIDYDGSNVNNNPTVYMDGSPVSVTRVTAPVGTMTTTSGAFYLGNRSAGDRNWDGSLAQFAVYNRQLNAREKAALTTLPRVPACSIPLGLIMEYTLVNDIVDVYRNGAPTVTGTAVTRHTYVQGSGGSRIPTANTATSSLSWTIAPRETSKTATQVVVTQKPSANCDIYGVLCLASATPPSKSQVIQGVDGLGNPAVDAQHALSVTAGTDTALTFNALIGNDPLYIWYVVPVVSGVAILIPVSGHALLTPPSGYSYVELTSPVDLSVNSAVYQASVKLGITDSSVFVGSVLYAQTTTNLGNAVTYASDGTFSIAGGGTQGEYFYANVWMLRSLSYETQDYIVPNDTATFKVGPVRNNTGTILTNTVMEWGAYIGKRANQLKQLKADATGLSSTDNDGYLSDIVPFSGRGIVIADRLGPALDSDETYNAIADFTRVDTGGGGGGGGQPPPPPSMPQLVVHPSGKYFTANGTPFWYQADAAWYPQLMSAVQMDAYIADRKAKGFNVIQGAILAGSNGDLGYSFSVNGGLEDHDGNTAFTLTPPPVVTTLAQAVWNPLYLATFDNLINKCLAAGMYIVITVAWGNRISSYVSTSTPLIWTELARQIGARWKNKPNVIYFVSGDSESVEGDLIPTAQDLALFDAVGTGLRNGGATQLISIHCVDNKISQDTFGNYSWLDFAVCQTFMIATSRDGLIERGFNTPSPLTTKSLPIINAEVGYENRDEGNTNDPVSADDIRYEMWHSVLQGAAGVVYGETHVAFFQSGYNSYFNTVAANDVQWIKKLIESRSWYISPAQNMISSGSLGSYQSLTKRRAAIGPSGAYAYIYIPDGGLATTIDTTTLAGNTIKYRWYNPRDGKYYNDAGAEITDLTQYAGSFPTSASKTITSPTI